MLCRTAHHVLVELNRHLILKSAIRTPFTHVKENLVQLVLIDKVIKSLKISFYVHVHYRNKLNLHFFYLDFSHRLS